MTATLRDVTATLAPPVDNTAAETIPANQRRTIIAIAVGAALALTGIVGYAAGHSAGHNTGRTAGIETGRVEALRECGAGLDNGFLGNVASFTAPRGHRTVVCAVPDEIFAD